MTNRDGENLTELTRRHHRVTRGRGHPYLGRSAIERQERFVREEKPEIG
ncbi:hypothetical protein [Streptomyces lutosisoli]|uniref:Integrase n=1 Tax=Streptomyces lutosisoli TaxID=2665721 RepID=A0ABW2V697_9ACTN